LEKEVLLTFITRVFRGFANLILVDQLGKRGFANLLLLDGVARCDSSGRDMPSAIDAGGPLDLDG
jgi:hypothetical protein